MKKNIALFIVIFALVGGFSWLGYQYNRAANAFMIDSSKAIVESAAIELQNTEQPYYISFVNVSDVTVKLRQVEFLDYQGIQINNVTISGGTIRGSKHSKSSYIL